MAKNAMKGSMGKLAKQTGKDNRVPPGLAKKVGKPGMSGKKAK